MLSKLCVLCSLAKLGANQTSWRDHLHAFLQPRQSSNEILPEMTRGCFAWYLSVWSAAAKDALWRRIQKQPERQRQRSQRERPRDTAERKWETGRTLCFICSPQWHRAHSLCVVTHCRPDTHPPPHTHTTHTCLNYCTYKEPQWNGASLDTVSSSTILTLSEARGSLERFFFFSFPPSQCSLSIWSPSDTEITLKTWPSHISVWEWRRYHASKSRRSEDYKLEGTLHTFLSPLTPFTSSMRGCVCVRLIHENKTTQ